MKTIIKQYKITNWCNYQEVEEIGSVDGMTIDFIGNYMTASNNLCKTTQWMNDQGEGWEIRSHEIADAQA
jgi:hypothetical protein